MENSYYPWNVQLLVEWLKEELANCQNLQAMSAALNIPLHELKSWFTSPLPIITLKHLQNIARYRGWDIQQTIQWLDLKPAHVRALITQEPSACEIKLDDSGSFLLKFSES